MIAAVVLLVAHAAAADAPAAPAPSGPRILVLDVKAASLPPAQVAALTQLLITELARIAPGSVVNVHEVARLADLEADRQDAGCTTTTCLAEIAGAYAAEQVVFGDEAQLGEHHVVNLQLFDTKKGTAIARAAIDVVDVGDLPARVPAAATALLATRTAGTAAGHADAPWSAGAIAGYTIGGVFVVGGGLALIAGALILTTPSDRDNSATGFVAFGGGVGGVLLGGSVIALTKIFTAPGSE